MLSIRCRLRGSDIAKKKTTLIVAVHIILLSIKAHTISFNYVSS